MNTPTGGTHEEGMDRGARRSCCSPAWPVRSRRASSSADLAQGQRLPGRPRGRAGDEGFTATGTAAAVNAAVATAGGTVANDLSKQIGVLVRRVEPRRRSRSALSSSALVDDGRRGQGVGKGSAGRRPRADGRPARGAAVGHAADPRRRRRTTSRAASALGRRRHPRQRHRRQPPRLHSDGQVSNVDCARGRNSVSFLPTGPGVGTPDPCIDNQFHGTHVAGHDRRARERDRRRRRRPERDARAGQGLRRDRVLLRERGRRRDHLRRRPASST